MWGWVLMGFSHPFFHVCCSSHLVPWVDKTVQGQLLLKSQAHSTLPETLTLTVFLPSHLQFSLSLRYRSILQMCLGSTVLQFDWLWSSPCVPFFPSPLSHSIPAPSSYFLPFFFQTEDSVTAAFSVCKMWGFVWVQLTVWYGQWLNSLLECSTF